MPTLLLIHASPQKTLKNIMKKDQESTRLLSEKNLPLGDICIHYKGQQPKKKSGNRKLTDEKGI